MNILFLIPIFFILEETQCASVRRNYRTTTEPVNVSGNIMNGTTIFTTPNFTTSFQNGTTETTTGPSKNRDKISSINNHHDSRSFEALHAKIKNIAKNIKHYFKGKEKEEGKKKTSTSKGTSSKAKQSNSTRKSKGHLRSARPQYMMSGASVPSAPAGSGYPSVQGYPQAPASPPAAPYQQAVASPPIAGPTYPSIPYMTSLLSGSSQTGSNTDSNAIASQLPVVNPPSSSQGDQTGQSDVSSKFTILLKAGETPDNSLPNTGETDLTNPADIEAIQLPTNPEGTEIQPPATSEGSETQLPAIPGGGETQPPATSEGSETQLPANPEGSEPQPPVISEGSPNQPIPPGNMEVPEYGEEEASETAPISEEVAQQPGVSNQPINTESGSYPPASGTSATENYPEEQEQVSNPASQSGQSAVSPEVEEYGPPGVEETGISPNQETYGPPGSVAGEMEEEGVPSAGNEFPAVSQSPAQPGEQVETISGQPPVTEVIEGPNVPAPEVVSVPPQPPGVAPPPGYPATPTPAVSEQPSQFAQSQEILESCPPAVDSLGCFTLGPAQQSLFPEVISTLQPQQSLEELFCQCGNLVQQRGWTMFVLSNGKCLSGGSSSGYDSAGASEGCINDAGQPCTENDTYCQGETDAMSVYNIIAQQKRGSKKKSLPRH